MSTITLTIYDENADITSQTIIPVAELKHSHDIGECDALCSYCYEEACATV